jgi:hypothetical protein
MQFAVAVIFQSGPFESAKFSSNFPQNQFTLPENYEQYFDVMPIYFSNKNSQREYILAKIENDIQKNKTMVDVVTHNVGKVKLTADLRFSRAIQPTRSIGDFSPVNFSIIRHPTVMRVTIPEASRRFCHILLCSDGMFHDKAFSNISQVCRFVTNPMDFIKENFRRKVIHNLFFSPWPTTGNPKVWRDTCGIWLSG